MKSFHQKNHITQQHGITEREYCVYLTFSFSLFTSFNRQEVMFVCDSKDNKSYLRDTNVFLLADEEFSAIKKTQIQQTICAADEEFSKNRIIEREFCVYLTFSFSLFTSFDRREVMFVCDSKDNKSYLRDTNETIFASRWRVFKKSNNSAAWKYRTYSRAVLRYSIQQTGTITVTDVWVLPLFTSFNRQEVMFVCDSKDNKNYLRDTNETIFASRWRVFFKKPT